MKIVDVDVGRLPSGVNPRGVRRRREARRPARAHHREARSVRGSD